MNEILSVALAVGLVVVIVETFLTALLTWQLGKLMDADGEAVEATLGRGECEVEREVDISAYYNCSGLLRYCPYCGRKVKR